MNPSQIQFLSTFPAVIAGTGLDHVNKYHGEDNGYFVLDERPREGREIMLFYTACNGRQIRDYIRTYRPEVYDRYYLVQIYTHSLAVSGIWRNELGGDVLPPIIPALFDAASVLIYNPVGANYKQYSDQNVLRYLNKSATALSYSGPHHGCWWVICPLFGEECVYWYFDKGFTTSQIWAKLNDGTFEPEFEKRFNLQMEWLKGHESGTDAGAYQFTLDHYRDCKLWMTLNHPSYNLVAHIADHLLQKLGFTPLGDDHTMSLDPMRCAVADHYPETHYEFEFYKFKYPIRYTGGHGGMPFFKKCIEDAHGRWLEKKKV